MSLTKIKDKNFIYLNIIVFIVFVFVFDLPRNVYNMILHNYIDRNYRIYGFCEKESYGYLEKIHNEYNKNINSYNFEDYPKSSSVFFFNRNYEFDENKTILLNYDSDNLVHKKFFFQNFSKYKILDNYKNKCFLVEKL